METRKKVLLAAQTLALAAAAAFAPSASALYVGMYAIGDFVPGGSGGCGGDDRGSWPGMAQAWWDEMGAHGHYKGPGGSQYKYVDGDMTIRRFCEPDTYNAANCKDYQSSSPSGVDWMDAAILAMHGWDDGDHWGALMRHPAAWNSECGLRFGGSSAMVHVGDQWIQFLHASSCHSADDDNLDGIRYAMVKSGSSLRAHQFDGFHGVMWISSSYNGDYHDTAADGHVVSVAYSWVTNHYKSNSQGCEWYDPFNWFGTCQDQCPIAYSISSTQSGALTRLNNERYNWLYSDPPGNSWYAYMYYAGCDPVDETTFNP